jgi:hypothetical protein
MAYSFYGYTVRATTEADWPLALAWTMNQMQLLPYDAMRGGVHLDERFWIDSKDEPRRLNFLVSLNCIASGRIGAPEPIAFFQCERVNATQVRLHFQASPVASRKKILRGITKLVPLMEKGLASGGVKHIFFTSHSLAMIAFMEKRMGYRLAQNADGGLDGAVMFKEISGQWPVASGQPNRPIHGQTAERGAK